MRSSPFSGAIGQSLMQSLSSDCLIVKDVGILMHAQRVV